MVKSEDAVLSLQRLLPGDFCEVIHGGDGTIKPKDIIEIESISCARTGRDFLFLVYYSIGEKVGSTYMTVKNGEYSGIILAPHKKD